MQAWEADALPLTAIGIVTSDVPSPGWLMSERARNVTSKRYVSWVYPVRIGVKALTVVAARR